MRQLLLFCALSFSASCSAPVVLSIGDQCELTSECDAPLVCRLGSCRKECSTSRDCAAGLDCLLDQDKLGACQLPTETHCALNSDCHMPLVCNMSRCTNVCTEDRDCPPGAMCVGGTACVDPDRTPCIYNSDCDGAKVCAPDQRCRDECLPLSPDPDSDCRYGTHCRVHMVDDGGMVSFCEPDLAPLDGGVP